MKKITIKDIAKYCGVSITTVSWVLNGKTEELGDDTVLKVREAIKELGYYRNEIARSLVTSKSRTIAIMIPDITNLFYASIVKAANEAAILNDYSILLCDTNNSIEDEIVQINMLDNRQIDGLIIASRNAKKVIGQFRNDRSVPIVVIDEEIVVNDENVQIVNTDLSESARKLTEYVINQGHNKIFILGGLRDSTNTKVRLEGVEKGILEKKIDIESYHIEYADYQMKTAYKIIKKYYTEEYSAIIAFNDMMAYGAIKALNEMEINNVSIAGFDAKPTLTMFNQMTNYDLTSINQDEKLIGKVAVETLINKFLKKSDYSTNVITIPSTLHKGNTIKNIN